MCQCNGVPVVSRGVCSLALARLSCSIEDMSTFCIRHIYPSTIADVLKETEEIEAKLNADKNEK